MNAQASPLSVLTPVTEGFNTVKRLLFQPFDIRKWFVIGFCAWLAHLGEQGSGGNFNFPGSHSGREVDFQHAFERARDYVLQNLYWIIPVAIGVVVLCLALAILFVWLSSRGRFMFLHCVALDRAEVKVPWAEFAREATSLFWFRIVLFLVGSIIALPLLVIAGVLVFHMVRAGEWVVRGILAVTGLGIAVVLVMIALAIVRKLTTDFVVPLMFLRRKPCLECWSELRRLFTPRVGDLVLYLLFQILIAIVIGIGVVILVLVTCCVAGCFLIIPYIGTVLLLPVLVFQRAYSIHYLAQLGPDYNVFPPAPNPAPTPTPAP